MDRVQERYLAYKAKYTDIINKSEFWKDYAENLVYLNWNN